MSIIRTARDIRFEKFSNAIRMAINDAAVSNPEFSSAEVAKVLSEITARWIGNAVQDERENASSVK